LAGDAVAITRAVVAGELDGGLPHATGRGMDEHQAESFDVAPAGRHRKRTPGRHRHVLREGSRAGPDDVGTDRQWALDPRAEAHDLAGGFEARHTGRLRASAVGSMGLHEQRVRQREAILPRRDIPEPRVRSPGTGARARLHNSMTVARRLDMQVNGCLLCGRGR
jgi:hypothetical protein